MEVDYIFTLSPNEYDYGDVLPKDCTKHQIDLGAVPNERCEIYPTPYIDEILTPQPIQNNWLFSGELPIIYS